MSKIWIALVTEDETVAKAFSSAKLLKDYLKTLIEDDEDEDDDEEDEEDEDDDDDGEEEEEEPGDLDIDEEVDDLVEDVTDSTDLEVEVYTAVIDEP